MWGKRPRRSKYAAQRTEVDGHKFASKKEAARYAELKLLASAGAITDLRLQVPIRCEVNGVLVCKYVADFQYTRGGKEVVEDAKGFKTDVYKLKKKLVAACTGIEITEV
jgi:hypothetical protein